MLAIEGRLHRPDDNVSTGTVGDVRPEVEPITFSVGDFGELRVDPIVDEIRAYADMDAVVFRSGPVAVAISTAREK